MLSKVILNQLGSAQKRRSTAEEIIKSSSVCILVVAFIACTKGYAVYAMGSIRIVPTERQKLKTT